MTTPGSQSLDEMLYSFGLESAIEGLYCVCLWDDQEGNIAQGNLDNIVKTIASGWTKMMIGKHNIVVSSVLLTLLLIRCLYEHYMS